MENMLKNFRELNEEKLEKKLTRKLAGRELGTLAVYLMIVTYVIIFSYFTVMKHYAFKSFAWDFGIVLQTLSTTINEGKFLYYTPELFFNTSGCYFGLHFSPIMLILLPLYALHQAPETLLVFQTLVIAAGALPLYWFTRDSLENRLAAVVFALTYLMFPPLQGANWFDFHIQCFLPLFFFLSMYYFQHEKWKRYFVFVIAALTVGESVTLVVGFMGLYELWKYRKQFLQTLRNKTLKERKILVPFITISIAGLWLFSAKWIQSMFFPIDPKFLDFYRALDFWSVLGVKGDPLINMPIYVILNPLKALEALTFDAYLKLLYIIMIFGSLLFLSFRSSIFLITIASLGPALLSNYLPLYVIGTHYPLYFIPFVFLASVEGVKKLKGTGKISKLGGLLKNLLVIGFIFALFASPLSPLLLTTDVAVWHFSEYSLPRIGQHEHAIQNIISLVPDNASVLTQNHIFPHFADRSNAYMYPLLQVFKYAPNETRNYAHQLFMKSDYVIVDTKYDVEAAMAIISDLHLLNRQFSLYEQEDGVYIYRNYS